MKSLTTIASELAIPIATVRYRIKSYEDFIPCEITNKGKLYSSEAEDVIRLINELYVQEKSSEEIMQILSSQYARDITVVTGQQLTETTQQQPLELVRLNNNLEKLIEAMNGQQELQRQINDLRSEFRESRMERNKSVWTKAKELLGW